MDNVACGTNFDDMGDDMKYMFGILAPFLVCFEALAEPGVCKWHPWKSKDIHIYVGKNMYMCIYIYIGYEPCEAGQPCGAGQDVGGQGRIWGMI